MSRSRSTARAEHGRRWRCARRGRGIGGAPTSADLRGGIARCEKFSILYMPTLLRKSYRGRRRERRAYDDDSRNPFFREAPWQLARRQQRSPRSAVQRSVAARRPQSAAQRRPPSAARSPRSNSRARESFASASKRAGTVPALCVSVIVVIDATRCRGYARAPRCESIAAAAGFTNSAPREGAPRVRRPAWGIDSRSHPA